MTGPDDRPLPHATENYRGNQVRDPGGSEFEDDFLSFDLCARYQLTDNFQLFADAVNINQEPEGRYYQGDAASGGRTFERFEDFGRTYQFGIVASF